MKRLYKMYREENNKPLIDLVITCENDKFEVKEEVNQIHVKDLTREELNLKLKELDIDENTKLEIKKGILDKHIGLFEKNKDLLEDKFLIGKNDIATRRNKMNETFEDFEQRMKKEFRDLEDKFKDFFD